MLGWEYATLAHCRSAASIAFLPKLNVLYFLAAHGTFYAVSRPYHALLNCGVAALFMCHATLYCVSWSWSCLPLSGRHRRHDTTSS